MSTDRQLLQRESEKEEQRLMEGLTPKEVADAKSVLRKVKQRSAWAKKNLRTETLWLDLTAAEREECKKGVEKVRMRRSMGGFFARLFRRKPLISTE